MNAAGVQLEHEETGDDGAGDSASIFLDGFGHVAPALRSDTKMGQRPIATVP
jgi:hypothetical protein